MDLDVSNQEELESSMDNEQAKEKRGEIKRFKLDFSKLMATMNKRGPLISSREEIQEIM